MSALPVVPFDPSSTLRVRMCERCVEELKEGMRALGEMPPRVPHTTGVKKRGRKRKLSDEVVKEIRDVWKRDMNRVLAWCGCDRMEWH